MAYPCRKREALNRIMASYDGYQGPGLLKVSGVNGFVDRHTSQSISNINNAWPRKPNPNHRNDLYKYNLHSEFPRSLHDVANRNGEDTSCLAPWSAHTAKAHPFSDLPPSLSASSGPQSSPVHVEEDGCPGEISTS